MQPDSNSTLTTVYNTVDAIHAACEKIGSIRVGAQAESRTVAVNVDGQGRLTGVWLRSGVLDSTSPSVIAKELTALLGSAGNEAIRTTHNSAEASISEIAVRIVDARHLDG